MIVEDTVPSVEVTIGMIWRQQNIFFVLIAEIKNHFEKRPVDYLK